MSGAFNLSQALRPVRLALLIIAALCLAVLVVAWVKAPSSVSGNLWLELAKTSMQVFGVAVIGGAVGVVTFYFQKRADDYSTAKQNNLEEIRRTADQCVEDDRRAADRAIDARHRTDEFLNSVLTQALGAYHAVKRVRRLLDAETRRGSKRSISIGVYDRHMTELNIQQLVFESLKRLGPICDDQKTGLVWVLNPKGAQHQETYGELFGRVESYLNRVIDEYQKNRYLVDQSGKGGVELAGLPKLRAFIEDTNDFRRGASHVIDAIVTTIQRALLKPIDLPKVSNR
jgi:hypothetical protein